MAKLGVHQNLSTAFHPQTDGLTERTNQWIEQYLRLVTSAQPNDWSKWLTIASAVHNDRLNSTLKMSPNQALLGYRPILYPNQIVDTNNQEAETRIDEMLQRRAQATAAINKAAHQGVIPEDMFQIGDLVWLEAANLKLPYQTSKLAPKRQGPFKIIKRISPVAYQLDLPRAWTIHDVFHASLLTRYQETEAHGPNFIRPPPDLIGGEQEYEVESLINHRWHGRRRQLQYLIKWKGYPHSDNTWEPKENVHADQLIRDYHQHSPLQPHKRNPRIAVLSISSWTPQTSTHSTKSPSGPPLPISPSNPVVTVPSRHSRRLLRTPSHVRLLVQRLQQIPKSPKSTVSRIVTSRIAGSEGNGRDNTQRPPCNQRERPSKGGQPQLSHNTLQTPNSLTKPYMNRTKGNPLGNPLRNPQSLKEASSDPDIPRNRPGDPQCHRSGSSDPDIPRNRPGDLQCHRSGSLQEYFEKRSGHNPQGSRPQPQTPRITPPPSCGRSTRASGIMPLEHQRNLRITPRVIPLTRVHSLCI